MAETAVLGAIVAVHHALAPAAKPAVHPGENGQTALRAVSLGPDLGDGRVEVLSGLSAGEQVMPAEP